jgi:hypothetical protein
MFLPGRQYQMDAATKVVKQRLSVLGPAEKLVPRLAVDALDVAVLHGIARHDAVPVDLLLFRPGEDGVRGELRAIVADDDAGPSTLFCKT